MTMKGSSAQRNAPCRGLQLLEILEKKVIWEAYDCDRSEAREESAELGWQYMRTISAKRKAKER